jgi:hypothetical protein
MLAVIRNLKKKRIDTYSVLQCESDQARRGKAAWLYAAYHQKQALKHHPSG